MSVILYTWQKKLSISLDVYVNFHIKKLKWKVDIKPRACRKKSIAKTRVEISEF